MMLNRRPTDDAPIAADRRRPDAGCDSRPAGSRTAFYWPDAGEDCWMTFEKAALREVEP